nr:MAG TPA: hypothetical protein [Caudoviricetes sp.]
MDVVIFEAICISGVFLIHHVFFKVFDRGLTVCNRPGFGYIHPFTKETSVNAHDSHHLSFV